MEKKIKDTLDFFRLSENTEHLRRVFIQGNLFTILYESQTKYPPIKGKRGMIRGFSNQARLRMLRFGHTINWETKVRKLFITLTYPDEVMPTRREELSNHKYLFIRAIETILAHRISGIWRLEWKPRLTGMHEGQIVPHWHLILFDIGYISYTTIRLAWKRIVGSEKEPSMRFEKIGDSPKAMGYISKYVAKATPFTNLDKDTYLNRTGRHYGYVRKSLIPRYEVRYSTQLAENHVWTLLEYLAPYFEWVNPNDPKGFALFGKHADELEKICKQIGLTIVP